MILRFLFSGLFFGFFSSSLFAQELPTIIPPSPDIASMGQYIDVPVSLSTGIPLISIPLVELKEDSFNIPISLSYHASGIRVNEVSSRVGLGWSLNTGGMISRSVRGIPDDETQGYINTTNTIQHYENANVQEKTFLAVNALEGNNDYESDIYYFNFLGESGKFFFNQTGNDIIIHPKKNIKISFSKSADNRISGWTITDINGTIYEFGYNKNAIKKESNLIYTKGENLPGSYKQLTSGWYLTKIINPSGNEISYTYTKSNKIINYWDIVNHSIEFQDFGSLSSSGKKTTKTLVFNQKKYSPIFLSKIESDLGKIDFEYNHLRQDLNNDNALTKVKLFDLNNKLIDSYKLDYEYFNSLDENQHPNYGIDNQLSKRLCLKKITQEAKDIKNKVYSLNYNTDYILPNRFSFSQDFWGYYNGEINNVLYPKTEIVTFQNVLTIDGADRTVSPEFAKACSLKEVIYPTKGKTQYIYESNTIGVDFNGEKAFFIGNKYKNINIRGGQLFNKVGRNELGKTYTSDFSITTDNSHFHGFIDFSVEVEERCNSSGHECPKIQIIKKDDNSIVHTFKTQNEGGTIRLPKGDYYLKIQNGFFQTDNLVNITLSGRKLVSQEGNAITGGLRIKEIVFKNNDDILINKRSYHYNLFDNLEKSSGVSLLPPIYYLKGIPHTGGASTDKIESNPIFPLNGLSSSHVNYRNVTQTLFGNGKIESEFSYFSDSEPNFSNKFRISEQPYPLVPSLDYSHRRGVLVKEKKIDIENKLKSVATYNYSTYNFNKLNLSSTNYKVGKIGDYSGIIKYNNLSERFYQTEQILKRYDKNGLNPITTRTKYIYDNEDYSGRTFPTGTKVSVSNGLSIITKTFYSDDVITESALGLDDLSITEKRAIDLLKKDGQNRISEPIQTNTYQDFNNNGIAEQNELLNVQRTNYKDLGNNLVLPQTIQASKGTSPLEDRITYHKYDTKGNPIEVSKAKGTHTYYIWGYNKEYPIAKIDNFTSAQAASIASLIIAAETASNADNDRTQGVSGKEGILRQALNAIRNHTTLSNAMITTYTYDPLIGVTSVTDPKGYTMYYEYDAFNRLKHVKDGNGKLLSENEYNYKN